MSIRVREQEEEIKQATYAISHCHPPQPAIEQPVYFVRQNGEIDRIGKTWICFWEKPFSQIACFKPTQIKGRSMVAFRNLPQGFTQKDWNQANIVGFSYRHECGGGIYFARNKWGEFICLAPGGPGYDDTQKPSQSIREVINSKSKERTCMDCGVDIEGDMKRCDSCQGKIDISKQSEFLTMFKNKTTHGLGRKEDMAANGYQAPQPEFPLEEEAF